MTGKEFIVLAERLAAEAGPAECRSAVSRAYYGAFHAALAGVPPLGGILPPKGGTPAGDSRVPHLEPEEPVWSTGVARRQERKILPPDGLEV